MISAFQETRDDASMAALARQGYRQLRVIDGKVCAIKDFTFATARLVGLDSIGYTLR